MGKKDNVVISQPEFSDLDTSWSTQVMVAGAVIGALTGLGAAYLLIQRSRRSGVAPNLNASEGLRLGLLVFGLLRQVSTLGED